MSNTVQWEVLTVAYSYSMNSCYCIERQQLVADNERLTSDKADLLTRLQCCEEDLKTANECEKCEIILSFKLIDLHFSIENERESYFRYDGSSTQEGH